jgi:hypothetical protein
VRPCVIKTGRQIPGRRIALTIGGFRLQQARRAGADEYADPRRAITFPRRRDRVHKTILAQRARREPVIPAIETSPLAGQRIGIKTADLAGVSGKGERIKYARCQRATSLSQRRDGLRPAGAQAGHDRKITECQCLPGPARYRRPAHDAASARLANWRLTIPA